jgi:hypothetical protein
MNNYLVFEQSLIAVSAFTYSDSDINSKDALWNAEPHLGTFLSESLLYIQDEYRDKHSKYKNYNFHLKSRDYRKVKIPPIGLMPGEGQKPAIYKPNGRLLDYIELGSGYWFVSSRMRALLEKHNIASAYWDAYIEIKHKHQPENYFLWTPLLALDAIDQDQSVFELEDSNDESILDNVSPQQIDKVQFLILDDSKIPENTPFFLLGFTSQTIALIRQDIAEEIQSLGYTGMEFKRIEDCEWMY